MDRDLERRINEHRDRVLNIVSTLQNKINELEFQNSELIMRDQQRVAVMNEQSKEMKHLTEELSRLKRYIGRILK